MTQSSASPAVEYIPMPGGRLGQLPSPERTRQFRAIGVLYVKDLGATVEFRVLYEKQIPQEVKDIVSGLFGIGAIEWSNLA